MTEITAFEAAVAEVPITGVDFARQRLFQMRGWRYRIRDAGDLFDLVKATPLPT